MTGKSTGGTELLRIEIELKDKSGPLVVRPVGVLTETADLSATLATIQNLGEQVAKVQLDLDRVTRINSGGVRAWIIFVEQLEQIKEVEFANLGEVFVELANVVTNMFGTRFGVIHSFRAPYRCSTCNVEISVMFFRSQVRFKDGKPTLPPVICKKCSSPLEFDWAEDEYLTFLKRV